MRATRFRKILMQGNANLFQRLNTIGDKARRDHGYFFHALFGQLNHGFVGIGFQPFGWPKA